MAISSPCKGCKDRNAECHQFCPKYLEFRLNMQEDKALRDADRERPDAIYLAIIRDRRNRTPKSRRI